MKKFTTTLFVLSLVLTSTAFALDYTPVRGRYSDETQMSTAEKAAVSLLTRLEVVEGNPDGSFAPRRTLNRAEFLKIALLTMQDVGDDTLSNAYPTTCFPDVREADWFSLYVCAAKRHGIVEGNPDGYFHPERPVNLAEATKILTLLADYTLPTPPANERWAWYRAYILAAEEHGVNIPGLEPDTFLTRGQMARLAAAFRSEAEGELDEYRDAERGVFASSSSSSRISSSSSSSMSSSRSSSSSSSSVSSGSMDPMADTSVRSQFILLGETSPVIGWFSAFIEEEAIDITAIRVNLTAANSTVQSFLVYDEGRHLLGRAYLDPSIPSNRTYRVTLAPGAAEIPQRKTAKFYVRAELKSKDNGGQSGQTVQLDSILIEGNGHWSNQKYTKASTETFVAFATSRSTITSVTNAGPVTDTLLSGTQRQIGRFQLAGRKSDSTAVVRITDVEFSIEQVGGVTLSNVRLRADGVGDTGHSCTVAASTVTCSGLPDTHGTIDDPRTWTLYADVTVPSDVLHPSLRMTINEPGSITTSGDITWTDGTTSFEWVALTGPVATGTLYKI